MAFLALSVIPALKITDRGLVDVDRFELVPLRRGFASELSPAQRRPRGRTCRPSAPPRDGDLDAIASRCSFLAVDAPIITAVLADLVEPTQGIVTILALAAIVLLLYRDDVMERSPPATRSSA